MTALLKSGAAAVRRLGSDGVVSIEEELRAELAEAHAALAARGAEIDRLEKAGKAAVAAAEARGHARGAAEADAGTEAALAALGKGLGAARDALARDLTGLERLAPLLAIEALDRIFGPDAPQREAVAQTLDRHLRTLDRQAVLCAYVSRGDFPEDEALAALGASVGVRVEALPELDRGACRLRLRLGALEVGPAQQWARLRDTLAAAAEAPRP
ncbi:MAG TPA: hypothetical protein VKI45_05065 [Allosphingosinicella sp.]|nr:hypothetical protein [Allosphingosinicella sp.]